MARVELNQVVRKVDGKTILDHVSVAIDDGAFIALIGPSGAGKTSVVRAIAGFDPLSGGTIRFDADDVTKVPTRQRDVSVIFQENTLFPKHRVRGNLSFPLRMRGFGRVEIRKRVEAESRAHDIQHILERWPESLSSGEQKLSQIARALVRVPRVFLMDEPLANLDPLTRRRLREELVVLQEGYGVTTIYASNHPHEIMEMPHRIVALEHGRVSQIGSPEEVRRAPASLAVAELTGPIGTLATEAERGMGGFWLTGDGIRLRAWSPELEAHVGRPLTVGVRSEDVRVVADGPIQMTAGTVTYEGSTKERTLRSPAGMITTRDTDIVEGAPVHVRLERWHVFDETGTRITTIE